MGYHSPWKTGARGHVPLPSIVVIASVVMSIAITSPRAWAASPPGSPLFFGDRVSAQKARSVDELQSEVSRILADTCDRQTPRELVEALHHDQASPNSETEVTS